MQIIQEELAKVTNQAGNTNRIWPLQSTGKICDKHGDEAFELLTNGEEEYCLECWQLEIKKQDKEMAYEAVHDKTKRRIKERSVLSDKTVLDCSFDNFRAIEQEQKENFRMVKELLNVILEKNEYGQAKLNNLWLTGKPGTGKTHLAVSMLKELNESETTNGCIFVSFEEAIRRIRSGYGIKDHKFTEAYFTKLCSEASYLVIDDIGSEIGAIDTNKRAGDDVIKILYAISNARQSKTTILTTNLSKMQLDKIYDPKLVSRLLKNNKVIKFTNTVDQRAKEADF